MILEAEGFEGLTMQRVAAAVGVRAPSLYKRVDGRRELVRLIAADAAEDLSRALEAAATTGDPQRDLVRIATAFRAFAHAHPEAYALLFRRLPDGWNPDVDLGSPGFAALFRTVEAISGDGATAGGGPHGRRLGQRVRRDGAGGRVPPRRGRRPRLRLRRRADRGGDQRATASRATMSGMQTTALIETLTRIVGEPHVLADQQLRAGYEVDWTGRYRGEASAVVRPGSVEEVAEIVRACRAARVPLVPQGGNTGLVGGGIPRDGAVLLSLRRLTTIEDVDPDSGTVVAGAGATVAAVHQAAAEAGWAYGVDLAARDSATVGGTIATNAGGIHVFRNGMTRDQVQGVEAVLGDGTVVSRLHASRKDNTGYALAQLLAGSEGTLGIVTAARLRLLPRLDRLAVAVLGISSVDVAVRLAGSLRRSLPSLNAVELIAGDALDLVVRHGAVRPIGARHPVYLLVEVADIVDPEPALVAALHRAPDVDDAVVATDGPARARLWQIREGLPDALQREGVPHSIDAALPLARLAAFAGMVPTTIERASPGARLILFGHLLDGNLHVNVIGPGSRRHDRRRRRARPRPRARRDGQRGARDRRPEGRLAVARSRRGRHRGDARDQARARPRRDPEPRRAAGLSAQAVDTGPTR